MLHIKPIPPSASAHIAGVYKDIQKVFGIESVPFVFQYIANFENYFFFVWDRMKINIQSEIFQKSCSEIEAFVLQSIGTMYSPSPYIRQFILDLHPLEKKQIHETVQSLLHMNIQLMLLMIDLREGMKSIFIGTERITQSAAHAHFTDTSTDTQESPTPNVFEKKELDKTTRLLVPLFGTNEIVVSHYPDFFARVATEMEKLQNSEMYLQKRVELEYVGLKSISTFVQPLGCSYLEFIKLTREKQYINELLYLITDSFPSQFPHFVFTAALMQTLLQIHTRSNTSLAI